MKYLEDEKLLKLTSELADVNLGRCRSLHGRVEAYTMKRVGTEKKYAHALGERYVADLENVESQLADYKTFMQRHAAKFEQLKEPKKQLESLSNNDNNSSGSGGRGGSPKNNNVNNKKKQNKNSRKRSNSTGSPPAESDTIGGEKQPKQRRRSKSFDVSAATTTSILQKKPLGDFGEIGTRRLMTDLILTLNSSFPDYDFGSIKPVDFEKIGVKSAIKRVNERLAEVNTTKVSFLPDMWSAMDDAVGLSDCEVYSYSPKTLDQDDDPLSFLTQTLIIDSEDHHQSSGFVTGGNFFTTNDDMTNNNNTSAVGEGAAAAATVLWTFNYFFVNKIKKRIVFFTCVECMSRGDPMGSSYIDEDDDISYVQYQGTEASEVDFDLDPSAGVAGGIPVDVPISIM